MSPRYWKPAASWEEEHTEVVHGAEQPRSSPRRTLMSPCATPIAETLAATSRSRTGAVAPPVATGYHSRVPSASVSSILGCPEWQVPSMLVRGMMLREGLVDAVAVTSCSDAPPADTPGANPCTAMCVRSDAFKQKRDVILATPRGSSDLAPTVVSPSWPLPCRVSPCRSVIGGTRRWLVLLSVSSAGSRVSALAPGISSLVRPWVEL